MSGAWRMVIRLGGPGYKLEGQSYKLQATSSMKKQKQLKNMLNETEQSNGNQTSKLLQEVKTEA